MPAARPLASQVAPEALAIATAASSRSMSRGLDITQGVGAERVHGAPQVVGEAPTAV